MMIATIEPNWLGIPRIDGDFEVEVDVNAAPKSLAQVRHRPRRYTGESNDGWTFGHPPKNKLTVSKVE